MDALEIPVWNQLNDPDPFTRVTDIYGATDCGWECCAMVIRFMRAVEWAESQLRELTRPGSVDGVTDGATLVDCLALHGVRAEAVACNALDMRTRVRAALEGGRPSIVLGQWVAPGVLHWVVPVWWVPPMVQFNDPWGGVRRVEPGKWLRARFAGVCVVVLG